MPETDNTKKLKVLIVCSGNPPPGEKEFNFVKHQAFIYEQVEAVKDHGVEFELFPIEGHGMKGYLNNLKPLKKRLKAGDINLVHAHGGMPGLLSVLQRIVPVAVTYHGSDVNVPKLNVISSLVGQLSSWSIFVSNLLHQKIKIKPGKRYSVIPCGLDLRGFHPMDRAESRKKLGWDPDARIILFASSFDRTVKNYPLAEQAVEQLEDVVELQELKDKTREEVCLMVNASDLMLMTSFSEGSPQIVKEAMACNIPVVTTNVGDVEEIIGTTPGCYITSFEPKDVAAAVRKALQFSGRTNGRKMTGRFDNDLISKQVFEVYKTIARVG